MGAEVARAELRRFASPVSSLFEEAGERLDELLARLPRQSVDPQVYARYVQPPIRHLFGSGGKLLRPLLLLLAAEATGRIAPEVRRPLVRAAAAVELLHTASLAHDDLVDASEERRGAASLHRAFGVTTAVLVGDLFYARFFQEIAALDGTPPITRMRVLECFLEVTARMCEGEILEEQRRAEGQAPSFDAYLHIIEAKTAGLCAASCRAGALLCDAPRAVTDALARYGTALGLLFQIMDDLADGDAPFVERSLLERTAAECRQQAESALTALPRNEASLMLGELPGHILLPARQ